MIYNIDEIKLNNGANYNTWTAVRMFLKNACIFAIYIFFYIINIFRLEYVYMYSLVLGLYSREGFSASCLSLYMYMVMYTSRKTNRNQAKIGKNYGAKKSKLALPGKIFAPVKFELAK